jgi:hypothetical protein
VDRSDEEAVPEGEAVSRERLIKGAGILGDLWRQGNRCGAEWCGICVCITVKSFCLGKKKWLALLREFHGGKYPHGLSGNEGFLVLECMDREMLQATGLKIVKIVPPARALLRIPPEENPFSEILKIAELDGSPTEEKVGPVVRVQELWCPQETHSEAAVS